MHLDQLQQQIRFNIAQLSATNGYSDFEKICLHFARKRIHVNILHATGPVQSGGDQGRDFETFHSYLNTLPNRSSLFLGDFSESPVAFACSLEKKPTKKNGKITNDVKSIIGSGTKVERIYFFSAEDIPTAERHKCQQETKKAFGVELEIIDSQTLSQQLTDSDLFWIAVQYLKMPSEIYPSNVKNDWYTELFTEYKNRDQIPSTFEEYTDIKVALRNSYKNLDRKKDVPFWLSKMDLIINNSQFNEPLKRQAIYERFVTSFVGLDNIEGQEENLKKYFQDFENYLSPSELEDAVMLLSFCIISHYKNRSQLSKEYLIAISSKLENAILRRIKSTENIDSRVSLIETHANFLFHSFEETLDSRIDKFTSRLNDILPLISNTHFYPIGRLLDRINQLINILLPLKVNLNKIEKFAEKIDKIVAQKSGKEILAEKLIERASFYLENEEMHKAISCLHSLKIYTFNAQSLRSSITSCLLLGDAYKKIDLFFAAKYYSLVAAFLCFNSKEPELHPYIQKGLSKAADCDYACGSWLNYINLIDLLIFAHSEMTKDFDVSDNDDTDRILVRPPIIKGLAEKFLPAILPFLEDKFANWGYIKNDIEQIYKEIDFGSIDLEENLRTELYGRPFNDVGPVRKVEFNASGSDWHFLCKNEFRNTVIMEGLIATFQIILEDLHDEDLYIPSSKVFIEISESDKIHIEPPADEEDNYWKIQLPFFNGIDQKKSEDNDFNYFTVVQSVLFDLSLLPKAKFVKILQKKSKGEISNKITFGRPHAEIFCQFHSEEIFDSQKRMAIHNTQNEVEYTPITNVELLPSSELAPDYNQKKSIRNIHTRIGALTKSISITLPLLKASPTFQNVFISIKSQGWLDWHVLYAITNIVVNYKANTMIEANSGPEYYDFFQKNYRKDEQDWYKEIPIKILTKEQILMDLNVMLPVSVLHSFGLELHSRRPNSTGILELLNTRFRFLEDGRDLTVF